MYSPLNKIVNGQTFEQDWRQKDNTWNFQRHIEHVDASEIENGAEEVGLWKKMA